MGKPNREGVITRETLVVRGVFSGMLSHPISPNSALVSPPLAGAFVGHGRLFPLA